MTDEQLADELVGKCQRCEQNVMLRWVYRKRENYRVIAKHFKPFWQSGTRRRHLCGGTNLRYKEPAQ